MRDAKAKNRFSRRNVSELFSSGDCIYCVGQTFLYDDTRCLSRNEKLKMKNKYYA